MERLKHNIFYINRWDIIREKKSEAMAKVHDLEMKKQRSHDMILQIKSYFIYQSIFLTLDKEWKRVFW